ncbi:unnamed protein product [Danaus chrysippus]|uniref:(African queen) hypothetical protein n=1 Tax=Danaus chrysippus TaxID=151541 RepID=A0A8J2R135_9NEOP|nr:unnamed protein product [Danaus chrysippus]
MFIFAIYFLICAKCIVASEEYVLNFDSSIYVCADEDSQAFVDTSEIEIKRFNETTAILTGDIKFMKEIGEKTMVEFIVEKEVGGRFDIVLTKEICDICEEMKDSESFYYHYLGIFGFPDECPIEPDTYHVKDFVANAKDLPINKQNEGRYQVTLNVFKDSSGECQHDRVFIACFKLDVIIEAIDG